MLTTCQKSLTNCQRDHSTLSFFFLRPSDKLANFGWQVSQPTETLASRLLAFLFIILCFLLAQKNQKIKNRKPPNLKKRKKKRPPETAQMDPKGRTLPFRRLICLVEFQG